MVKNLLELMIYIDTMTIIMKQLVENDDSNPEISQNFILVLIELLFLSTL